MQITSTVFMRINWDPGKAAENEGKHGVTFEEASEVFDDPGALEVYDAEHSQHEPRYAVTGLSSRRLLFVVYAEKRGGDLYWLISARKANRKERERYEDD